MLGTNPDYLVINVAQEDMKNGTILVNESVLTAEIPGLRSALVVAGELASTGYGYEKTEGSPITPSALGVGETIELKTIKIKFANGQYAFIRAKLPVSKIATVKAYVEALGATAFANNQAIESVEIA